MSKFVVVVFPNEAQAYQGTRAFMDLHAEGSITLYGMAVVAKDAEGKFAIKTAKVAALEQQISNARADAKDKVRQRIATMRTEHATRSGKLKQAWALTKEALAA